MSTTKSDTSNIDSTADENQLVFGFDVEWRPSFTGIESETFVSLIQLATDESAILIQMKYFETTESRATLIELLNDKNMIQVGVGVLNDLQHVEKDFGA